MTTLDRPGTTFTPPKLQVTASGQASPSTSLKAARWLAMILLGVNGLFFVAHWTPEVRLLPGSALVLDQLSPLASPWLTGGSALGAAQQGIGGLWASLALVGGLVTWTAARSRVQLLRLGLLPGAALVALAAAAQFVSQLGYFIRVSTGLVLLAVVAALAVNVWRRGAGVDTAQLPPLVTGKAAGLWIYALTVVGPLAVGRMFLAPQLSLAAANLPPSLLHASLSNAATFYLWAAGTAIGIVWWSLAQFLRPRSERRLTPAIAGLVLAIGPGLALCGPLASSQGAALAERLQSSTPARSMPDLCTAWWRESGDDQTLAIHGGLCREVSVFRGYQVLATRTSSVSLGRLRDAATPEGKRITSSTVSGLYGGVFVAVGTTRSDREPSLVAGLDFNTGRELWRYRCSAKSALKVRLAGTGKDESSAGRITNKGEGAAVVINCGGRTSSLDPQTGKSK